MRSFMSRLTRVLLVVGLLLVLAIIALFWMGGRQRQYDTRVVINAPPELVYFFLTDPETVQSWSGSQTRIQPLTEGGHHQGAKTKITTKVGGLSLDIESEVIETTPNERLITALASRQMMARSDFQLEDQNGSTVLTHSLLVSPRGLSRFFAPFSGNQIQMSLDQGLNNLRRIIETEAKEYSPPQLPVE